jgi:hypothetical protein
MSFQLTVVSNVPPVLTPQSLSGTGFSFSANGIAGPSYTIQASTNLVTWTNLATTNPANTPFSFTDTNAGSFKSRFYRVTVSQ